MRELRQGAEADGAFELRISRALEERPEVDIPEHFVTRVMGSLPAEPAFALRATSYGRAVSLACAALLLAAVVALAPRTGGGSAVWLILQGLLCAQLVGLLVWLRAFSQ